jgi:hypothetical protein
MQALCKGRRSMVLALVTKVYVVLIGMSMLGLLGILLEAGSWAMNALPTFIPVVFGFVGIVSLWLASNYHLKSVRGSLIKISHINKLKVGLLSGVIALILSITISAITGTHFWAFALIYSFPGIILGTIYWLKWRSYEIA